MSLIASPQQLDTPWRDLIAAAAIAVLLPSALGLVCLGLFRLFGQMLPSGGAIGLWAAGMALMLSPLLSAAGMLLALPVCSLLVRLGWFGWLPAAATGLVIGAVIGAMMDFPIAAPAGLAILLVLRASLGVMRPMNAP